jgi:hypothetical protein
MGNGGFARSSTVAQLMPARRILDRNCQFVARPGRGRFAMATMNVSLPEAKRDWVEAQTRAGRYSSAKDHVRDLIWRG